MSLVEGNNMADKLEERTYSTTARIEARRKVAERFARIREEDGICPGQMSHDGKLYCVQSRFNQDFICPEEGIETVSVPDTKGNMIVYNVCHYKGNARR
jgi:hypothetical protein